MKKMKLALFFSAVAAMVAIGKQEAQAGTVNFTVNATAVVTSSTTTSGTMASVNVINNSVQNTFNNVTTASNNQNLGHGNRSDTVSTNGLLDNGHSFSCSKTVQVGNNASLSLTATVPNLGGTCVIQ